MGARISPGFTIIETVLFLSVTGLLVMGVLIGTGAALNTQRYRDSVESFKDLLQTQYADLGSVKNSREDNWSCNASATAAPGGSVIRGQSDCLLVGKYMRIDRGEITIYPVLAIERAVTPGGAQTDIEKLDANYTYNVASSEVDETSLEWGTQIAWPAEGSGLRSPTTPRTLGILFIRSPDSGAIYTFSSNKIPEKTAINQSTFTDIIRAGLTTDEDTSYGQSSRSICILSSGLSPSGDMAVFVKSYAASASAVEIRSNQILESLGETTRC